MEKNHETEKKFSEKEIQFLAILKDFPKNFSDAELQFFFDPEISIEFLGNLETDLREFLEKKNLNKSEKKIAMAQINFIRDLISAKQISPKYFSENYDIQNLNPQLKNFLDKKFQNLVDKEI